MQAYDLLVVGGGINGAAVARDAAGRGLSVCLVEAGDPAGATSGASSKLIHGGLRYLEQCAFGLVRESLRERTIMLRIAPHLTRPCRFVLPLHKGMRPAWMVQLGLWLYDKLGGQDSLPDATRIRLDDGSDWAAPLKPGFKEGFLYFDVQVDDARLVILTLRDAEAHGADILTRTRFLGAHRDSGPEAVWQCHLQPEDATRATQTVAARAIVNAAGPWVSRVLDTFSELREQPQPGVQLVRGSHIVVPRCYAGEHAYTLQNEDGRVVFLLPFHEHWTLIGTTDVRTELPDRAEDAPQASIEEINYLCHAASRYLNRPVTEDQIAWTYAGLRPLYDDGKANPSAVTRDYRLVLDKTDGAPLLSVFGGKLTTHRHLAEVVMDRLAPWFPHLGETWTADTPLPGGDSDGHDFCAATAEFFQAHDKLPEAVTQGLWQRHGTLAFELLENVRTASDLGQDFGAGLTELEALHFIRHEWAHSADDILWRRSKAGLMMSTEQRARFIEWFQQHGRKQ